MINILSTDIIDSAERAASILNELEGITIPDELIDNNVKDGSYDDNSGYKNISYNKLFKRYIPLVGSPTMEIGKFLLNVSNLYKNICSYNDKETIEENSRLVSNFEKTLNNIYTDNIIDVGSYQNCQFILKQLKDTITNMLPHISNKKVLDHYDKWMWFYLESLLSAVIITIELSEKIIHYSNHCCTGCHITFKSEPISCYQCGEGSWCSDICRQNDHVHPSWCKLIQQSYEDENKID